MTGITEPIEFAFVFASPFMYYLVHCVLYGISGILVYVIGAGVGLTFSGGIIDFILYGVLPGNHITNWIPVLFLGLAYFVLYFIIFSWGVRKFDWKVPGREDLTDEVAVEFADASYDELDEKAQRAYRIVAGLGGSNNLNDVTNCATRLRVQVKDGSLVNEALLKQTGSAAVVVNGQNVQVVYGTTVPNVKSSIDQLIASGNAPTEGIVANGHAADITEVVEEKVELPTETGKLVEIYAPATGKVIDIAKVNDPVFGGKIMGEGFAVQPTNGNVVSPVDAEVVMIMDSKHAVGLKTADGLELLIHMGIETVQLNGGGFELFVQEGDQLKAGDAVAQMDLDYILNEGKQTDVIVALTNTPDMVNRTIIEDEKSVEAGSSIGQVDIKA